MIYYLDTSACVAAFTPEAWTGRVQSWFEEDAERALAISPWVLAEFESALSIKVRTGGMPIEDRARVAPQWRAFCVARAHLLAITMTNFTHAAQIAARHALAMRASDALHLAIAAAAGCTLVTLDERMAKAAPEVGVPVAEIP